MSDAVKMPALGESVTEGTVTRWLKQVGDSVEIDEPLLEVSTDKVDTEVPSPVSGVLLKILVDEDETVDVGADLAFVGDASEVTEAGGSSAAPAPSTPPVAEAPAQASAAQAPTSAPVTPAPSSPPLPEAPVGGTDGTDVTMPALGESVTEGTVTRWLKQVGDSVEIDEPLLEVSTDKVDTEVPSPVSGMVSSILVSEDETVDVGTTVAVIGGTVSAPTRSGSAPQAAPALPPAELPVATPAAQKPSPSAPATPVSAPVPPVSTAESQSELRPSVTSPAESGTYMTPLVRKLAHQKGIDLAQVQGTGIGGRIRKQDVLDAAAKAEATQAAATPAQPSTPAAPDATRRTPAPVEISPLRGTSEKMTRLRRLVAHRMVESLQTSAQLTTVVEVDLTRIVRLRAQAKTRFADREGVNLTFLPFFARAALEALKSHPKINASIEDDTIYYHGQENLGIAVDTSRGLVVPVIQNAGDLDIAGLAKQIADLADRTRENKVGPDDLAGGTFTITNTGSGGALFDTPIIPQPQVAILGTGTIVKRPVVVKDTEGADSVAVRSMVYLSLSYDHRLVDGADAARYLMAMKSRLEEGAFEDELGL